MWGPHFGWGPPDRGVRGCLGTALPWSLALSIPVLDLESVCRRKGCPWPWLWLWIFCVLGFGLSLEPCVFDSTSVKKFKFIPDFKKGHPNLVENYRPISILSVFLKILEKIVLKRLYFFCNRIDILSNCQIGFRKSRPTSHPCTLLTSRVTSFFS